MPRHPFIIRLPFGLVDTGFCLDAVIAAQLRGTRSSIARTLPAFGLSSREKRFARTLLQRKRNLWLYRCNQRAFCGDFVLVDMSVGQRKRRPVTLIELKAREALHIGRLGHQLQNAGQAVAALHDAGVAAPGAPIRSLQGDKSVVLGALGVQLV